MNEKVKSGIITVLSIALLAATIVVSYGALQAEAAKSGTDISWCYESTPRVGETNEICSPNHGECTKAAQSDATAVSGCFKKKS